MWHPKKVPSWSRDTTPWIQETWTEIRILSMTFAKQILNRRRGVPFQMWGFLLNIQSIYGSKMIPFKPAGAQAWHLRFNQEELYLGLGQTRPTRGLFGTRRGGERSSSGSWERSSSCREKCWINLSATCTWLPFSDFSIEQKAGLKCPDQRLESIWLWLDYSWCIICTLCHYAHTHNSWTALWFSLGMSKNRIYWFICLD